MKIILFAMLASNFAMAQEASQKELEQKLKDLVIKSQEAKPACERFRAESLKLAPYSEFEKPLSSRKDFDALFSKVKNYPGENEYTAQGEKIYYELMQRFEKPDIAARTDIYICDLIAFLQSSEKLVNSVGQLGLKAKEKKNFLNAILPIIRREAGGYSLMHLLIAQVLLQDLIEKDVLVVSDPIFVALTQLQLESEALRLDIKHRLGTSGSMNMRNLETDGVNRIRNGFLAYLSRVGY
jgi:hypothetical protein